MAFFNLQRAVPKPRFLGQMGQGAAVAGKSFNSPAARASSAAGVVAQNDASLPAAIFRAITRPALTRISFFIRFMFTHFQNEREMRRDEMLGWLNKHEVYTSSILFTPSLR
jgi:hypothetical protein